MPRNRSKDYKDQLAERFDVPRESPIGHKKDKPTGQKEDFVMRTAKEYLPGIEPLLNYEILNTDETKRSIEVVKRLMGWVAKEGKNFKTHQLRNIFNLVMGTDDLKKLNLLRPKLAYIGARQSCDEGKVVVAVIDGLIVQIIGPNSPSTLDGLKYIMESMVAYHRFFSKD